MLLLINLIIAKYCHNPSPSQSLKSKVKIQKSKGLGVTPLTDPTSYVLGGQGNF